MKKITLFYLPNCPYCLRAKKYLTELLDDPTYKDIEIEAVDEQKEKMRADSFDYYFVPTFYVGEDKVHEGICDFGDVIKILDKALV